MAANEPSTIASAAAPSSPLAPSESAADAPDGSSCDVGVGVVGAWGGDGELRGGVGGGGWSGK